MVILAPVAAVPGGCTALAHKFFDRGEYRKATKTPEGWLRAEGRFSRTGVLDYVMADGSILRQLRLPEEVFHPESLASFQMLPLTNLHPRTKSGLLDSKTAKGETVGSTGDSVKQDGEFLAGSLMVVDAKAVADVESGERRELSCGYTCEWDETPGTYNGQPYDVIQRKIRGNHVALVDVGRAGPEVRVLLDAGDGVQADATHKNDGAQPPPSGGKTVKKTIGGVEVDVSDVAGQAIDLELRARADALAAVKATADSAAADLAAAKAEKEKISAKVDALADDLAKTKKALTDAADPKKFRATVEKRLKLEAIAKKHLGDDKVNTDASDKDLMVAVLGKVRPSVTLDGKSEEYLAAAFEFANLDAAEPDEDDEEDDTGGTTDELAAVRKLAAERQRNTDKADDKGRAAFLKKSREAHKQPLAHTKQ